MLWTDKANKYLKKYWNIEQLKDKQIQVINSLLLGNDVIGLLPTGYGKSLCYILPAMVTRKVIFIISPLISLMDEQKEKLVSIGIPCAALHGNNDNKNEEIQLIMNGKIKIVYMSPEYLIKSDGLDIAKTLIENNQLKFLAVDESHCISVWGQDFRPEYTQINKFREYFPEIPIIAVTATATETVCKDITKLLNLNNPDIVKTSFDRPNLSINIIKLEGIKIKRKTVYEPKEDIIINYVNKYKNEKIIIYTNSRKDTEEIANNLNKIKNNCCAAYHAGFSKSKREEIQTNFTNGNTKIIISTTAFGMGIDQIVKCVLIFGCPSSIEEYYQQIGRGGRDGLPCETVLYFDKKKLNIARFLAAKEFGESFPLLYKSKIDNLNKIKNLIELETCRRKYILKYFNEDCKFTNCNNCDNCCKKVIKLKENKDETIDVFDKFDKYNIV